jgi:hypothetical protein
VKIIYTQGDRVETPASGSALRKILGRFLNRRVFYEMSSRDRTGNVFFSTKNRFVVGQIDVVNRVDLSVTIFDRENMTHSIAIFNPATMRLYEELQGKSFAVAFVSEHRDGVESRCYLRDDGPEEQGPRTKSELEKISLPQLFEYLEDITTVDAVGAYMDFASPMPLGSGESWNPWIPLNSVEGISLQEAFSGFWGGRA